MLDGGTIQAPTEPRRGGINLAPVAPLVAIGEGDKRSWEESPLIETVREFHQEISQKYLGTRRQIAEVGRLVANVRSGKLLMKPDPLTGAFALFKALPKQSGTSRHVYPLAQINSSQLTSQWVLSQPKIVPRHFGSNNKAQIQHVLVEKVIEHYAKRSFGDELFAERESLSMMDYGTAAIRSFYDDKLNAMHRLKPVIQNVSKTAWAGFGYCRDCLRDGTPEDFAPKGGAGAGQCPDCGSFNVSDMSQPEIVEASQVIGHELVSQGDVTCELLSIPSVNWDQRKFIHESSYTGVRTEVSRRFVESILGIAIAEEGQDADPLLATVNSMGSRGGSVEGLGRDDIDNITDTFSSGVSYLDEEWYMPEWYAGRKLPEDEKTVSGEVIPKGTPLEKIFPDGMFVMGFNDMQAVTWIGNEKRYIRSGVYHLQSGNGTGKGTADSIEINEQLNIAHSANLNILKRYGAGGGYAFDERVMNRSEAEALLKPDALVGLKLGKTGYTSIDQAIKQIVHSTPNQQSLALIASLSNLMSIVHQADTFTEGVANANIDVNTLGGQQMLQAKNEQRSAAPLRMKGWFHSRVIEDMLELFRDNMTLIPKVFGINDKFALTKSRALSGKDMPDKIECDFVQDSETPTNRFTKQEATSNMLEKSQYLGEGGFVAVAQFNPRLAAWFASQFPGVEIPLFDQNEILMVCQDRIDRIAELSEEIEARSQISGFFPDPAAAAQEIVAALQIPMSEENPVVKAEVLKEYLDDDEVKEWSPIQKAAVEQLIQQHYINDRDNRFRVPALDQEGQMMLAMKAAPMQMAMQAGQMGLQEDQTNRQRAAEQEAAAAEAENASLDEVLSRLGDEVQNEFQTNRDDEAAENQHQRKMKEIAKQNEHRESKPGNAGGKRK